MHHQCLHFLTSSCVWIWDHLNQNFQTLTGFVYAHMAIKLTWPECSPTVVGREVNVGSLVLSLCSFFHQVSVPLEVLEEIFLNLPPQQVVLICRLVCRQWKAIADSQPLWRDRCRREGHHLLNASRVPQDWRLFYFLCKKKRNLLKNPRGEGWERREARVAWPRYTFSSQGCPFLFPDEMRGWQILENSGDRWKVENVLVAHPCEGIKSNFVTSYG